MIMFYKDFFSQKTDFRKILRKSAITFIILCPDIDNSLWLQQSDIKDKYLNSLIVGSNNPQERTFVFDF